MDLGEKSKLYIEKPETDRYFVTKFQTPLRLLDKGGTFKLRKKMDTDSGFVDGFTKEDREKETEEIRKKYEGRRRRKRRWVGKRDTKIQPDWLFQAQPRSGGSEKTYLGRIEHRNEHNPYCLLIRDESGYTAYPLHPNWYEFKPVLDQQKFGVDAKMKERKMKKLADMWDDAPLSKVIKKKADAKREDNLKQRILEKEEEVAEKMGEADFTEVFDTDVGTFDKENDLDISHEFTFERPKEFDEFDYMKEMITEQEELDEEKQAENDMESILRKRKRGEGGLDDDEMDENEPSKKKQKLDNLTNFQDEGMEEEVEVSEEERQYQKLVTKVLSFLLGKGVGVRVSVVDLLKFLNIKIKKDMTEEEMKKYKCLLRVLKSKYVVREKVGKQSYCYAVEPKDEQDE